MKKLQLYVCLLLFGIGHTMLAQNPFTEIKQNAKDQGIFDQDILTRDIVHIDDVIVIGSLCVGFDCVNGESFGFDTIRMKENNLRMHFQDTSSTASFPTNDWRFIFNDSANGGANYFAVEDSDAGRQIFRVEAGAPANSLYVDDGGRVGLGTNNPVVDLHILSGNTPTMRLAQDNTSGFTPQTWDVAGNEAGFFIRDATNGSTLPFRIIPGSPSNAIYIDAGGDVGFNTSSPIEKIDVEGKIRSRDIIYADNQIGVGTGTPNQFASLAMLAVDKGLLINRLTTAERTTLTGLGLAITEEGLMVYDTDDQTFYVWDGTAWVALTTSLTDSDDQALTLNVNSLDLEDGGSVDLTPYLDNTDDQALSLNANSLDLEDGGSVDLSPYLDNTDDQDISGSGLAGNILTIGIESGASEDIDLSSLNNSGTDDQQLTLAGNNLDLEDGGSVDLSGYLDNTDNQEIAILEFDSPNLKIEIEGGNIISVDISSLLTDLQDENDAQQAQIDDLIARMEIQEDCACDPLGVDDFNLQPDRAYLLQNVPNPFNNTTTVGYFVPFSYLKANIIISNINGQILENINLSQFGEGSITIDKGRMATAIYLYTLFVDGKKVDTRRMVVD